MVETSCWRSIRRGTIDQVQKTKFQRVWWQWESQGSHHCLRGRMWQHHHQWQIKTSTVSLLPNWQCPTLVQQSSSSLHYIMEDPCGVVPCVFPVHGSASEYWPSQTLYQGTMWNIPKLRATIPNLSLQDEWDSKIEGDCQDPCNELGGSIAWYLTSAPWSSFKELFEKVLTYEELSLANFAGKMPQFGSINVVADAYAVSDRNSQGCD